MDISKLEERCLSQNSESSGHDTKKTAALALEEKLSTFEIDWTTYVDQSDMPSPDAELLKQLEEWANKAKDRLRNVIGSHLDFHTK